MGVTSSKRQKKFAHLSFCSFEALNDWMVLPTLVEVILFTQCTDPNANNHHRCPKTMVYQIAGHPLA
jgi:hypothetical protein